jgi:hypothetical protein
LPSPLLLIEFDFDYPREAVDNEAGGGVREVSGLDLRASIDDPGAE